MAPQHSGFIQEYPLIRVDNFTAHLPRLPATIPRDSLDDLPRDATHHVHPHVLLLSHCHTDHLAGLLSAARHGAPIYCSAVTKKLLLALERKDDRERFDKGLEQKRVQPYAKLQRSQRQSAALAAQMGSSATGVMASSSTSGWDVLTALPLDTPTEIQYTASTRIRLTLLSANHMPGSTMFLIQGPRGSVLHTGDARVEAGFVEGLLTRTHLSTVSVQLSPVIDSPRWDSASHSNRSSSFPSADENPDEVAAGPNTDREYSAVLSHLYLDTERILDSNEPPAKSKAIVDLIQLLRLLGPKQRIHINCWTSGYEQFLLAVHRTFGASCGKIHVDRYKAELYQKMSLDSEFSDLSSIVSTDRSECLRFCACDNEDCMGDAIQIKPEEGMSISSWQEAMQRVRKQVRAAKGGRGEMPTSLSLPLQRHSPLRELYRTIALLRPRHVTANTGAPAARFILARCSERLRLSVMCDEDAWQKANSLSSSESEERQWAILESAWSESASGQQEGELVTDFAFFERIGNFKRLLYGLRNDLPQRLRREMLDAEAELYEQEASKDQNGGCNTRTQQQAPSTTQVQAAVDCKAQPWTAAGTYASTGASPFRTRGMGPARPDDSSAPGNAPVGSGGEPDPPPGQAVLTIELASRYLAYTAMYLGWRIRNPSRYSQDVAWRALRKVRPELAKTTEEALQRELGWPIPPWSKADKEASIEAPFASDRDCLEQERRTPEQDKSIAELTRDEGLEDRLSHEAESQGALFAQGPLPIAKSDADRRRDIDIAVDASKALWHALESEEGTESASVEPALPVQVFSKAEECLRANRPLVDIQFSGRKLFDAIIDDWTTLLERRRNIARQGLPTTDNCLPKRLTIQLTLVGTAAKSRGARRLLGWESVDFYHAFHVLSKLCLDPARPASRSDAANRTAPLQESRLLNSTTFGDTTAAKLPFVKPQGWPGRTLSVLRKLDEASKHLDMEMTVSKRRRLDVTRRAPS